MIRLFHTTINKGKSTGKGKGKGKGKHKTDHEGQEGKKRYSSTLSLTSALDGVSDQRHAPATLRLRKSRHPFYRPQGRSGRVRKISPPTGTRSTDRPAHSESLYRLSYRGPYQHKYLK